jgi:hypothetical protein
VVCSPVLSSFFCSLCSFYLIVNSTSLDRVSPLFYSNDSKINSIIFQKRVEIEPVVEQTETLAVGAHLIESDF